jgi:hypothetical protein
MSGTPAGWWFRSRRSARRLLGTILNSMPEIGFNLTTVDAWFGAVSSLAGVAVGAIATNVSQERLWRRTTRRDLYGSTAAKCNVAFDSLLAVRYAIRHKELGKPELDRRWNAANALVSDASAVSAQVVLVSGRATRKAARRLEEHLQALVKELYGVQSDNGEPRPADTYRDEYAPRLTDFLSAATRDLGFRRIRSDEPD